MEISKVLFCIENGIPLLFYSLVAYTDDGFYSFLYLYNQPHGKLEIPPDTIRQLHIAYKPTNTKNMIIHHFSTSPH